MCAPLDLPSDVDYGEGSVSDSWTTAPIPTDVPDVWSTETPPRYVTRVWRETPPADVTDNWTTEPQTTPECAVSNDL